MSFWCRASTAFCTNASLGHKDGAGSKSVRSADWTSQRTTQSSERPAIGSACGRAWRASSVKYQSVEESKVPCRCPAQS